VVFLNPNIFANGFEPYQARKGVEMTQNDLVSSVIDVAQ